MLKFKKCNVCGQIVEVLNDTGVPMICCGQEMEELKPGTSDGAYEKHIPYVTSEDGKHLKIKIGEVLHPATIEHHIEWILIETNLRTVRYPLSPTEAPERIFELSPKQGEKALRVYEYCNLHGLYVKELE